jgi:hypothetical protein
MGDYMADDELATQLTIPSECFHPLQYAVMGDHLVDNDLAARRTKPRALGHLQISS